MQYYLYPESLKIMNVNPTITINDTSVINSKYVFVIDNNIPPQRNAFFFGHGTWNMSAQMSGDKLYMSAPIYDNFPAGTTQDYFLEWRDGYELTGISGTHTLPSNIKSVGDNANIPNGFLVLDNSARGQLTLTADSNFITNTTYKVESVEGNTRTTIADKGYTGFRQNPQATFNVNFPGKTPQTLAISQTKINVEMTVDNNLVTNKSLGFANNQLSSTAYGAILPLSNTGSTIPKYATSVVKSQDDPLVTFNLNSQNRNNTIGKIAVLRPGNNGLSRVEINHDGSANGIRVPFDYFTKAGNNDSYEAMFLLYGKGADANKVIGHAVISLPRNQLKEDSADYDFGLGQILMILNKAGNGVMLKAMVPHGLLTRADEFVLLNERKPNSVYNTTMEMGELYDIVSIDGVLKDTPQPGTTTLQFGIRKDGELKRGKRITLTQLNVSAVVEGHDNANNRIYTYDYASADRDNQIDVRLIKNGDSVYIAFFDKTGKNVTNEVDDFTIVHNSATGDQSWFNTFVLHVGNENLKDKLQRSIGYYFAPASDKPKLVSIMNDLADKNKRHGVVLVRREFNNDLKAIYNNAGFVHMTTETLKRNIETIDLQFVKIDPDHSSVTAGIDANNRQRVNAGESRLIPQLSYTNPYNTVSIATKPQRSAWNEVEMEQTTGAGKLPKDIAEGNRKYVIFTFTSPIDNQSHEAKLYKDPYIPNLYTKDYMPRMSTVKHIGYFGSVDTAHSIPFAGEFKRSDKIGFDVDYTLRRNALVRDINITDAPHKHFMDNLLGIVGYRDVQNGLDNTDGHTIPTTVTVVTQDKLRREPAPEKVSLSPNYSARLPDINQDFTDNCGEANRTRDLSEWRVEATIYDTNARLDMSEYPIMDVTGSNLRPISKDILRIRAPQVGKPVILNEGNSTIFTEAPRVLVIESDICFGFAPGVTPGVINLFPPDIPHRPFIIVRGRLLVQRPERDSQVRINFTKNFTIKNETWWRPNRILDIVPLPKQDADTNTGNTTIPATGEATIDIVSEYIHERTGSTSLSSNIIGARKFISVSKKDNLYGPYDNMANESGDSFDLAVVEIAVKLPGDNNKYPIAVDKKTRHYVGDTVRYYISGNLPEPLRRNPWDDPLQVEIVTTIYRGVGNGSRYEIIRSARGRLVSWQHPQ